MSVVGKNRWFRTAGIAAIAVGIQLSALSVDAFAQITQCIGGPNGGLCPASGTLCNVSTIVDVVPGTHLNCAGKDVNIVAPGGGIRVTGGTLALSARNLVIQTGRSITAVENPTAEIGLEIEFESQVHIAGRLSARNAGGLSYITVHSGQAMEFYDSNPGIDVSGSQDSCDGGDVILTSHGNVSVRSRIDANGKDGGTEDNINAGGIVVISTSGNVDIKELIRADGRFFDGGFVEVSAGGSINVDFTTGSGLPKGEINVEGRNSDGYGGTIDLVANHAITVSGPIRGGSGINSGGGYGQGAYVGLEAGCGGIVIDDLVDITGGADGGGVFSAYADGPVTLSSEIKANSRIYGGDGGTVLLSSGGKVTLARTGLINVDGHDTTSNGIDGEGGVAVLQGCQVEVVDDATTGGKITALGAAGGEIQFDGAKSSLVSPDFSVRIGDKALLDATGATTPGGVAVKVSQRRWGTCSNNANATCQTSDDCVFGCNGVGTCNNANPDTQSSLLQFHPSPVIQQATGLLPCTSICN